MTTIQLFKEAGIQQQSILDKIKLSLQDRRDKNLTSFEGLTAMVEQGLTPAFSKTSYLALRWSGGDGSYPYKDTIAYTYLRALLEDTPYANPTIRYHYKQSDYDRHLQQVKATHPDSHKSFVFKTIGGEVQLLLYVDQMKVTAWFYRKHNSNAN